MRTRLLIPLLLAGTLWSSPASASLITLEFSGTVTSVDAVMADFMPLIVVGSAVSGAVTFDPTNPGALGARTDLFVEDYHAFGPGPFGGLYPATLFWSGFGVLGVEGPLTQPFLFDFMALQIDPVDPIGHTGSLSFAGFDACTLFPPTLCLGVDETPEFRATITSVTQVPDAGSTAFLLIVGIGALGSMRHRLRRFSSPGAS